eukprot:SM000273S10249  [mRNA]  locus=s273:86762:87388:- [translate_table: standard]
MRVERWDAARDGPLSERAMADKLAREGYRATRYAFAPGTAFDYHSHAVDKKDSIAAGRFLFRMAGDEVELRAGDMLEVPRDVEHYAEVVGNEPVILFDATRA